MPQVGGASGIVCRMRSSQTGSECVFKLLALPLRQDDGHPNILTFLDCTYDQATSRFIIATEWMDCLSLRDHMPPGRPIPEPAVGGIISQTVFGLAHLHSVQHTAHRDIKPSNILLNSAGNVKITDLCQSRQLAQTLDMMGTYVGQTLYMSPERIQGARYTANCDVWSVGLIAMIEDNEPPRLNPATCGATEEAANFCRACLEYE
ncbi:hypothetical protein GUITHDRAFT_113592 [Guillardia theta CCMP2712]|uniref:mitogen-activated protein kinase kinase n=1 Tax=Guillardia theta (strain CCMP2712) TaxID=905079 RepID=L1IWY7_GUITC|nr:hypothetical protein GUITHDRAFT_113592 [Guillardia theta CCMP2712]EKX40355.1 hypothetical protein GUITHDRAFT_113592 [Guillardia theta CCMP2712]|eukprot:XP_005827335.1 hypothetical protein GUITHDRAFT_113592 [Guillardia theta CCMP2712]